ncbi:TIGR03086 family metal-binding protein [Streptomyces sp. NPDC093085]|uniref:TIGR03086 family metal-binding protein n=1 Tax=Streptomyces sp. NPDC093085 TaxID=3155068 RepID=UPI003420143C
MRILFTAVPAHGHILPLAPLMAAAAEAGHPVALLTGAGDAVRHLVERELAPEVELLDAGAPAEEFLAEAARRTGGDPLRPDPSMIAEIFGGARLGLDAGPALARAEEWAPELVVAEAFDTVGPLVAACLGVPWYQMGVGPGVAPVLAESIAGAVLPHYERAGAEPLPPAGYLDPCPPVLQDPEWSAPAPVLPVRAHAHRRPAGAGFEVPPFADPGRPTVLLTLGTVFSDAATLAACTAAVADAGVNILATLGVALPQPPAVPGAGDVRFVPFAPLDQLLDGADLVVAAGGSGTVLAALSRGIPMVLHPQGADQPLTAARAEAAGVATVVDSAAALTGAVTRALNDPALAARAGEIASYIAKNPAPGEVIAILTDTAPGKATAPDPLAPHAAHPGPLDSHPVPPAPDGLPSHPVLPVLDDLARVVRAGTPEQDPAPTPCDGLDVAGLRRHLLGGLGYFALAFADPEGDRRPDPRAYTGPDGPDILLATIGELSAVVRAALADGITTAPVQVPALGGTFPGAYVLSMLVAEVTVHGWDMARATGRSWHPDPAASEQAYALLADQIRPEFRGGDGLPFAPEVPVAPDAPALDRLLGFAGRRPEWTPPAQGTGSG